MREFKIGDEVICIENPNRKKKSDNNKGYGFGWQLGFKFRILCMNGNFPRLLWKGLDGCGVYEDCVRLVEDTQKKLASCE